MSVIRWPRLRLEHALLAVGCIALVMMVDAQVSRIAAAMPRSVIAAARFVTDFGTSFYMFVLLALTAAMAVLARSRGWGRRADAGFGAIAERAVFVFSALAAAGISAQVVKHLVGRARPRFLDTLGPYHFDILAFHASRNSFPSGHSANAFAAAVALGMVWPRGRPWLLAAAVAIALSRILVRAHYPSDTLAGALLGSACAVGLGLLFARHGIALRQVEGRLRPRGDRAVSAALSSLRRAFGSRP